MKARRPFGHIKRRRESGYALLMVVFLAAALLIATAVIMPNLLTQGTREKEEELVWRGQQYARGVRLYYRKYGRFPQSFEDLTRPKNEIRFLRKAYTDPMNREDGSWRLIYVSPTGQLIGSVKPRALAALPAPPAGLGAAAQPAPPPGTAPQAGQPPSAAPGAPAAPAEPAPSGPGVEGKVFGGNIIGVGSKVNRPSIRIYDGGGTYREWEFIWDPTKDAAVVGQPVVPGANPPNPSNPPTPNPPPLSPNPPMRP